MEPNNEPVFTFWTFWPSSTTFPWKSDGDGQINVVIIHDVRISLFHLMLTLFIINPRLKFDMNSIINCRDGPACHTSLRLGLDWIRPSFPTSHSNGPKLFCLCQHWNGEVHSCQFISASCSVKQKKQCVASCSCRDWRVFIFACWLKCWSSIREVIESLIVFWWHGRDSSYHDHKWWNPNEKYAVILSLLYWEFVRNKLAGWRNYSGRSQSPTRCISLRT